jgi:hypothetical protein
LRYTYTVFISLLIAILSIGGCDGNNTGNNGALPPDPNSWVCRNSLESPTQAQIDEFCSTHSGAGLDAPSNLQNPPPLSDLEAKNEYDLEFLDFLESRVYVNELGWAGDMNWRLSGPYVGEIGKGQNYGVHPAIRIYYSPEVIEWLCNGREGGLPDGAIIIKEMHSINNDLGITLDKDGCMVIQNDVEPQSWTVMVKQSGASFDGWYWSSYAVVPDPPGFAWEIGNPPVFDASGVTSNDFFEDGFMPTEPNPLWYPTGYVFSSTNKIPDVVYPYSEYGNNCINCHASAESESTFSSLHNLLTRGIEYKQYDAGGTTRSVSEVFPAGPQPGLVSLIARGSGTAGASEGSRGAQDAVNGYESPFTTPLKEPAPEFLNFYNQLDEISFSDAWLLRLPAESYDHVVSASGGPGEFITSDQCIGCHDSSYLTAAQPNMVYEQEANGKTELVNLSQYGEWRASPMGLAGRDPIFFSQLQSETNNLPEYTTCVQNTCLHCHGVMGQRQLAIDTPGQDTENCKSLFPAAPPDEVPFGKQFSLDMVTQWPGSGQNEFQKYGALARDGISCTVCHHMSDVDQGKEETFTGNFVTGPADEVYGPYTDDTIVPKPMQNAIGITPGFKDYFVSRNASSSDACGSCHNILLPIITNEGEIIGASYEQTTNLEWINSDFAPGRPGFLSCADCHMPTTFDGKQLSFPIANIESNETAPTTDRLPDQDITLTERDVYARHSLHGLNLFINQFFQQFPIILGARQIDYMTGTSIVPSLITGADSIVDMAKNQTADVDVQTLEVTPDGKLKAVVKVTNKVGHFLPSGVSFRRVFIEFLVRDADGNVLWASGRTNKLGAIVKGTTDEVLPSEEPLENPDAPFQPHYQTITSDDEVQIYQELIEDSDGHLTTSFLRRFEPVKDNRIRPRGYDPALFLTFDSPYIQALAETHGEAANDPYYTDPALTGADVIEYLIPLDEATLSKVHDVKVTLYNQSIPPFYLQDRFNDANQGPAEKNEIQRLHYLTSHLNVDQVADGEGKKVMKDWKLFITSTTAALQ